MGPKKGGVGGKSRKSLTIEIKKQIIEEHNKGTRVVDLAQKFELSKSTIGTILAKKEQIVQAKVAKGMTKLCNEKVRKSLINEVERLLLVWINERQMNVNPTSQELICEKARMIFEDLKNAQAGLRSDAEGEEEDTFKASRGWFHRFQKRSGIHSMVMHGETASADKDAAKKLAEGFQKLAQEEGYNPDQSFNSNETGLFRKKMPRSYITREKRLLGHKPMKERLLFAANASGLFKVKPLLVYNNDNLRAFKKKAVIKSKLPVFWKSNRKAWEQVAQRTLNCAFKALAPGFVHGEAVEDGNIMEEIADKAKQHQMGMDEEDTEKLLEGHHEELREEHEEAQKELLLEDEQEENKKSQIPTSAVKDLLKKWDEIQKTVLEWHPNEAQVDRVVDLFNDRAIKHFRNLLRERQATLDEFLQPRSTKNSQPVAAEDQTSTEGQSMPAYPCPPKLANSNYDM